MTKAEFIEQLADLLMEPPERVRPEFELSSAKAWDSTAVVNLIVLYSDAGATVDEAKIPECKTVQDLLDLGGDALEG